MRICHTGHRLQPEKPLLRLRIIYNNDAQMFDKIRWNSRALIEMFILKNFNSNWLIFRLIEKYCDVVANPLDIIMWKKKRTLQGKDGSEIYDDDEDEVWSGRLGRESDVNIFFQRRSHFALSNTSPFLLIYSFGRVYNTQRCKKGWSRFSTKRGTRNSCLSCLWLVSTKQLLDTWKKMIHWHMKIP